MEVAKKKDEEGEKKESQRISATFKYKIAFHQQITTNFLYFRYTNSKIKYRKEKVMLKFVLDSVIKYWYISKMRPKLNK